MKKFFMKKVCPAASRHSKARLIAELMWIHRYYQYGLSPQLLWETRNWKDTDTPWQKHSKYSDLGIDPWDWEEDAPLALMFKVKTSLRHAASRFFLPSDEKTKAKLLEV